MGVEAYGETGEDIGTEAYGEPIEAGEDTGTDP